MMGYCSSPPTWATPEVTYDFETHKLPRICRVWASGDLRLVTRKPDSCSVGRSCIKVIFGNP